MITFELIESRETATCCTFVLRATDGTNTIQETVRCTTDCEHDADATKHCIQVCEERGMRGRLETRLAKLAVKQVGDTTVRPIDLADTKATMLDPLATMMKRGRTKVAPEYKPVVPPEPEELPDNYT